jgi:hypothetical protein
LTSRTASIAAAPGRSTAKRDRRQPYERRRDDLHERAVGDQARAPQPAKREAEPQDEGRGDERRGERLRAPRGVRLERPRKGELRRPVGVGDAPVGARAALRGLLPGLVEHLHQVVVEVPAGGAREELAYEPRLLGGRGDRAADAVAAARPADLADHHAFHRERALQLLVAGEGVIERVGCGHPFPVRQQVRGDEVDVAGELRVAQPHVPRLGGGHRLLREPLHPLEVCDQLVHREVAAQERLVAHHDPLDVRVLARGADRRRDLHVVVVGAPVEPGAERDANAPVAGERDHVGVLDRAVRADPAGHARDTGEVLGELVLGREAAAGRVLVALEPAVCDAGDRSIPVRQLERRVEPSPCAEVERRQQHGDGQCGEECGQRSGDAGARQGWGVR